MDIKTLQAFVVLAETLHFGRAAEQSHLSASALTRLLQRLESELGVSLFQRDNRHVALTPEGQQFLVYARDALQRWQACRQSLHEASGVLRGELRLFCSVTASYHFLSQLLPRFRRRYPDIDIHLHTGDQAESVQRIASGREDLAIAARGQVWMKGLAFLPLATSPLVFIASDDERLPEPPTQDEGWSQIPLIVAERGLSRDWLDDWFRVRGLRPRIQAQVAGHEAIVSMVGLGYGVGVVPQLVLDNSPLRDQVRIWPQGPALPALAIGLCCRQKQLANPLVQAFWSEAGQAFPVEAGSQSGPAV